MKIIEITAEKMTEQQLEEVKNSTLKEIHVLNIIKGHSSISKWTWHMSSLVLFALCLHIYRLMPRTVLCPTVTLIDSYESATFIFLVFDL